MSQLQRQKNLLRGSKRLLEWFRHNLKYHMVQVLLDAFTINNSHDFNPFPERNQTLTSEDIETCQEMMKGPPEELRAFLKKSLQKSSAKKRQKSAQCFSSSSLAAKPQNFLKFKTTLELWRSWRFSGRTSGKLTPLAKFFGKPFFTTSLQKVSQRPWFISYVTTILTWKRWSLKETWRSGPHLGSH